MEVIICTNNTNKARSDQTVHAPDIQFIFEFNDLTAVYQSGLRTAVEVVASPCLTTCRTRKDCHLGTERLLCSSRESEKIDEEVEVISASGEAIKDETAGTDSSESFCVALIFSSF